MIMKLWKSKESLKKSNVLE